MHAEFINNKLHYFGNDKEYEFVFTDEKYHNYATLIIKPQHLKFIKNPDKITKEFIIEEWFAKGSWEGPTPGFRLSGTLGVALNPWIRLG